MSVSHCMGHALLISKRPVSSWPVEIARLPDSCVHADCGAPKSCRQRCTAYLDQQRRMLSQRPASRKGGRR